MLCTKIQQNVEKVRVDMFWFFFLRMADNNTVEHKHRDKDEGEEEKSDL